MTKTYTSPAGHTMTVEVIDYRTNGDVVVRTRGDLVVVDGQRLS